MSAFQWAVTGFFTGLAALIAMALVASRVNRRQWPEDGDADTADQRVDSMKGSLRPEGETMLRESDFAALESRPKVRAVK